MTEEISFQASFANGQGSSIPGGGGGDYSTSQER